MSTTSVTQESPTTVTADAVIVGYYSTDNGPEPAPGAEAVDAAFSGGLAAALATLGASGAEATVHAVPSLGVIAAPMVLAVGLGSRPEPERGPDPESIRRAAGAALRSATSSGTRTTVALALPATTAEEAAAATLGASLGNYVFDRYRSAGSSESGPAAAESILVVSAATGAADSVTRAQNLADSVTLVRDLVNAAPGDLVPEDFAGVAEQVGREHGLKVETLDEHALAEGGYGGHIGVGQGSVNPPRLVRLSYTHPQATATVALLGKGITFDSGGLSLKPSNAMDWMKSDMAGAAAVLGALRAIAANETKVNVVGYLALAENMPSGTAQRPSDVLTIYGGRTVEVMNTDAEGRLVLADALVRAQEDSPDLIVDVATLTGAQLVALGTRVFGIMANNADVRAAVATAADDAGENAWPMPLPEELRKGLDSTVADISNISGDRWGGMLVAGVFLREFVADGVPWAHLDIAGPAFNQGQPYGYTPTGGTGAATRTLVRVAGAYAAD